MALIPSPRAVPVRPPRTRTSSSAPARRVARGFTLIEVLAAAAIFALLGTLLFQIMQGAMEVWSRGQRVRDLEEQAGAVLEVLAEDVRHVFTGVSGSGDQDARFVCEFMETDHDGDGLVDGQTTLLRFTRLLHEARSLEWLDRAGERAAVDGVATLVGEEDVADLRPTGGLAESLYTTATLPGETLPSLVRKVRTPIGGPDSLVAADLRSERLLHDAVRLVDRVLFFGVQCWTPDTTDWDGDAPASSVWDSTRGLLPRDAGFPYGRGPASLLDGRDDTWPTLVRITLVLDPYEGDAVAPGILAEDLLPGGTRLVLRAPLRGDERAPSHVWVGGEWMAVTAVDGAELGVARGAVPREHTAGTQVRTGPAYRRDILLPAARENFDP